MASRLLLGWLVGFHNDEALMGLWLGKREGDRDDSRERKLLELSLALQPLSRMFKDDFLRSKNKLNIWGCPGASIIT